MKIHIAYVKYLIVRNYLLDKRLLFLLPWQINLQNGLEGKGWIFNSQIPHSFMLEPDLQSGVPSLLSLTPWGATPAHVRHPSQFMQAPSTALKTATLWPNQPRGPHTGCILGRTDQANGPHRPGRWLRTIWVGSWGLPYLQHSPERIGDRNSGWHLPLTALRGGTQPEKGQHRTL